jgi:hypothetical protein
MVEYHPIMDDIRPYMHTSLIHRFTRGKIAAVDEYRSHQMYDVCCG